MSKEAVVNKMEEIVQSLRGQLEKNDGSTLSTIYNNAKLGFETLMAGVMGNKTVKAALKTFKKHAEDFEEGIKKGDKKLSAMALGYMEKTIHDLKSSKDDEDD